MYSDTSDSENTDGQTLEIPSAIQEMFTGDSIKLAESTRERDKHSPPESSDDGSSDNIGYFKTTGFESSPSDDNDTETDINHDFTGGDVSVKEFDSGQIPPPSLSTYLCWKCSKAGHLAQDCTVVVSARAPSGTSKNRVKISAELQAHYARCREIRTRTGDRCAECGIHSNLACCLECG